MQSSKRIYRAIFIDVSKRTHWIEEYPYEKITGPVDLGVILHLERYESWRKPAYHPDNALIIGAGLFTGTKLYGSHRFIAVFKSPMTNGLHAAAMGGAAYQFNVNADAIVIVGKSSKPLIVKIFDRGDGDPVVEFYELELEKLLNIWRDYKGLKGVYALQEFLTDMFRDFYERYPSRSILVGPGSLYTNTGALVSLSLVKGQIDYGSEDFAARAGGGSVLLKAHGVAAIIYGGLYDRSKDRPADLTDIAALNKIYTELMGKPYTQVVIEAGVKYRYDPKVKSGGTLGGNYPHLGVTTPMLHWNSIYYDKKVRQKLHDLIMKYMWEPFNKEAIETKSWKTCGEPCPLVCKKVRKGKYKSDYEPYNGLGPFIGIFDIHEVEKVVELADAYGIDAIELGYIIGFIFEAVYRGLLKPEEVGLSGIPELDPEKASPETSAWNAKLAVELIEKLAFGLNSVLRIIGERGVRDGAKILDLLYAERVAVVGVKFSDLPVYAVFGEKGHISPNYYWTPGLVAPLYVLGKYWTVYSGVFMEPEEFASKSFERAIYELLIENAGYCRFHRGWAEKTIPILLEKYYGIHEPLKKAKETYKLIAKYQKLAGSQPQPWDSKRITEFIAKAAEEYGNSKWAELFKKDIHGAAEEWWNRFYKKIEELLTQ
ncbi:MAG: aldehyde ferredoxin oxidoreductase N-terminal domain-containing protein [Desulfurococcaceae archaeon]